MKKKLVVLGLLFITLITSKMACRAVEILQSTNFNNGVALPWNVSESNDYNSYSKVVDGQYMVHIDRGGTEIWDVQIRHKEFVIKQDHTYNVSFKVHSQKPMKIRARIGDADDRRNWKEYWRKEVNVISTEQTVTGTFVADSSYNAVEFSISFGGNYAQNLPNEIFFDDISLSDDEFVPTPTAVKIERNIHVNQLGYFPEAVKKATLVLNSTTPVDVQIKNGSGSVVWTGISKPKGLDVASGDKVHIIDFSDFKTPGKGYRLYAGGESSFDFDIGTDMYTKMKYDSLKYFYHARSGIEINMPYCVDSKWARPAGHSKDVATLFPGREYVENGSHTSTQYIGGPATIDGTGGWYDGGDYGKYVVNGGFSTWMLQNQYERASKKGISDFEDDTMNIPESGNAYPDLLDEARWNMEYFLNVQIPEGSNKAGMVIYKLCDEYWGLPGINPDGDLLRRYFYPPTTDATLNFAACAAQAARLWSCYDADFSNRCLKAAEIAWKAAVDNPDIRLPSGQELAGPGGNMDTTPKDEFYWAACELFITTGKSEYLDFIKASPYAMKCPVTLLDRFGEVKDAGSMDFENTAACGTIDLILNAERCKSYGLAQSEIESAKASIAEAADVYTTIQNGEGYGVPYKVSTYVNEYGGESRVIANGYPINSNLLIANQNIIMAYAYDFTGSAKYMNGVVETMDYLMGRNPINQNYVSGYGEKPMKYPHHLYFCPQVNPSFPSVPPGFLSSGPNSGLQDPWASSGIIEGTPAMECYLDHVESWSTNQVSSNLNASLAWLTAYLDGLSRKESPTPVPTSVPDIKSLDVSGDGVINMMDIVMVAGVFNSTKGDTRYVDRYDFNSDNVINMADIMMLAAKFNTFILVY